MSRQLHADLQHLPRDIRMRLLEQLLLQHGHEQLLMLITKELLPLLRGHSKRQLLRLPLKLQLQR